MRLVLDFLPYAELCILVVLALLWKDILCNQLWSQSPSRSRQSAPIVRHVFHLSKNLGNITAVTQQSLYASCVWMWLFYVSTSLQYTISYTVINKSGKHTIALEWLADLWSMYNWNLFTLGFADVSSMQAGISCMMTSSNGNIFRVTGHMCGEFTGPRWIPRTKASDAKLWCFLWSASE